MQIVNSVRSQLWIFHSLSGKSLNGLDYPITDGIMSDCLTLNGHYQMSFG